MQHTLSLMRVVPAICVLLVLAVSATSAQRAWKKGMWGPRDSSGVYTIETATDVISQARSGVTGGTGGRRRRRTRPHPPVPDQWPRRTGPYRWTVDMSG